MNMLVFFLLLEQDVETNVQVHPPKLDYPEHVRKQVFQALLVRSNNGKLGKQDTTIVAGQFGVKIQSVQRIWKQGKNQLAQNIPVVVVSLKKGRCGRKATPLDLEKIARHCSQAKNHHRRCV
jgi:hypothetical protein